MFRRLLWFIGLWIFIIPTAAQFDILDFQWELADIAFSYPAGWDDPVAFQQFGVETVILAESDVQNSERAPEIPFIEMTWQPPEEIEIETHLQTRLTDLNIQPDVTIPSALLDAEATLSYGTSRDEAFYGIGTIAQIDDFVLTIVGRVPIEQQQLFEYQFNTLIRSITRGGTFGDVVPYGLVWTSTTDATENLFFDIQSIALDEASQAVYATDAEVGLLRFDMLSGRLEKIIPNPDFGYPTSTAIHPNGTIYIGDPACPCIHVYQNNEWQDPLEGFNVDTPLSIHTMADGTLYASDIDDDNFAIREYSEDGTTTLKPSEDFLTQPILFSINGQLHTYDDRQIQQLNNRSLTPVNLLDIDTIHYFVQVAPDGTYILAQGSTIDFYTPTSLLIDSIDISEYSPGTSIGGLALGQDNTLYVAVNGTDFSEVIALSKRVPETSIGLQMLAPYRITGSFLSPDNTSDIWLLEGTANEVIDIAIQGFSQVREFDYSITLIAPDGSEVVTVEEDSNQQPLSRSLNNLVLESNGIYELHINHITAQGSYDITLITPKRIIHDDDITIVYGQLPFSYSHEQWVFEAIGQTTLTFTAEALDPTQLDPQIGLYDTRNQLVEQNNDAPISQGNTAQITEFTVPFAGNYTLEVSRLEGIGRYRLIIETVEPTN